MFKVDRRSLIVKTGLGLTAGLGTSFATSQFATAIAGAHKHYPKKERIAQYIPEPEQEPKIEVPLEKHAIDPVFFWNDVTSDLVALDHSIDAKDSRAPGPCASTRAVGLAYIVMADAVAASYPCDYQGLYRQEQYHGDHPDVFVGAATAWMLEYIFNTPAHSQYIGAQRMRFLQGRPPSALRAWEDGLNFARHEAYTSRWDAQKVQEAIHKSPTSYVAPPRGHTADPFNPDQGFYGVTWAYLPPFTPRFGQLAHYGPGDPPRENDEEYRHDYHDVITNGALHQKEPTPEQINSGLFWAYDGARLIGTPVRYCNQILIKIAQLENFSLPETARMLALCNISHADASLVSWGAKYYYRLWRPVVHIRENRVEWAPFGSPRTNPTQFALGMDTRARPTAQNYMGASERMVYVPKPADHRLPSNVASFTPNFPSYPSGHATFATACFNMLRKIREERGKGNPDRLDPPLEFVSDELNGLSIDNFFNKPRPYVPRTFNSLSQIVHDIIRSRVFLGVHWNFDCDRGAKSGAKVAKAVYENCYPIQGNRRNYRPEVSSNEYRPSSREVSSNEYYPSR